MNLDLNQFLDPGSLAETGSSLASLFEAPPRLVSEHDVPAPPPPASAAYVNPFTELARDVVGPLARVASAIPPASGAVPTPAAAIPPVQPWPYGYDPAQSDQYIPLTEDEMRAKAEARVEMITAFIVIASTVANGWAARQALQKGDRDLIKAHKRKAARTGSEPVYSSDHAYHAALERYEEFETELKDIEKRAELSESQKSLLFRAIYADIKAKDMQRRLRNFGVIETVGEIMIAKLIESFMMLAITFSTKSFK